LTRAVSGIAGLIGSIGATKFELEGSKLRYQASLATNATGMPAHHFSSQDCIFSCQFC
jgi:hypothetical protein